MARTTQLNWSVPKPSWETLMMVVEENHEREPFYVRFVLESVMKEFINRDDLADIEDLVDELSEASPHSLPSFSQLQYSISDGEDVDSVDVTTSVNTDLVNEFREVVREDTDYRMGIALAHAIHLYSIGGRVQRLRDKLQRLLYAETGDTSDYNPAEQGIHYNDVDLDRLDGRSRTKKHYQIAQQLDPAPDRNLHPDRIMEVARDVAGPSVNREDYVEPVVEILNFKPHPSNPVLFVHESWEPETDALGETATPANVEPAAVDRKSFDEMTKDERLESIRLQLARKADRKNRRLLQIDYNFIRREVFDRQTSAGYANNAMADAADAPGYEYVTKEQGKRLKVNLGKIDDDLRNLLSPDPEPDPEPSDEPAETAADSDVREDVAAEVAALKHAEYVTDGGRE